MSEPFTVSIPKQMDQKRYSIRYKRDGLKLLKDAIFDQKVEPHTTFFTGLDQPIDFKANRLMHMEITDTGKLIMELQFNPTSYADIGINLAFANQITTDGEYSIYKPMEGPILLVVNTENKLHKSLSDIEGIYRNSFSLLHSPVAQRSMHISVTQNNLLNRPSSVANKKWLIAPTLTQGDPAMLHNQHAYEDIVQCV